MENLYQTYLDRKAVLELIKKEILEIEKKLWLQHDEKLRNASFGTTHIDDGNYRLTVVKKETIKLNEAAWFEEDMHSPAVVEKRVVSLNKKKYDALLPADKIIVDEYITTNIGKPTFTVSEIEA